MKTLCRLLCNCFTLGELPAGGTWGSVLGLALAWNFAQQSLVLFAALCFLGYVLTLEAEKIFLSKDPAAFVLDEVCGMMLAVLWLPKTWPVYAAAFILFRIFDIKKPWPISALDKMKHPFSIMNDDIAAGLFVNLILQVVIKLFL